ncbi:Yip1 family protein [Lysinibacillus sp. 54212]|uniref:Yip1 family protein n=1 Tax=Lysinibacillus sp. 54212 TaxID=3119829 RepID=UPI002FCCB4B0
MENQQTKSSIDDRQPILSIAYRPRDTVRYVLDHKSFQYSLYVGIIGGFSSSLITMNGTKYPYQYSLGEVVYSSFVTSVFIFVLTNLLLAGILSTIGAIFSGKGNFKDIFRAMCLTVIPYIWILPVILFWMQLSPDTFFHVEGYELQLGDGILLFVLSFVVLIATLWSFFLTIITISEVHHFSKWKAFFTIILGSIVAALVFFVIVILLF